jgi:hypothetical protein
MRLAIDELSALVHPRDDHPKVLAMLQAYLDESGIHEGASIFAIAGYFGGPGQWRKFEILWQETLTKFGIPLDGFHGNHFVNSKRTQNSCLRLRRQ